MGNVQFLPFRYNQLPWGWYFANGTRYPNASPVAIALNALSAEFKADWGITNNGVTTNVPNWFHGDGRGPATNVCLPGLYKYPVIAGQKVHLTSKPVALVRDLLAVTGPDATVIDPFMGGGTTGVACMETGRSFVGVELSEAYFDLSVQRLGETMNAKAI